MLNDHLRSMIYDKYIKPTENRRDTYAGIRESGTHFFTGERYERRPGNR